MKGLITLAFLFLTSLSSFSQAKIELQLAGANFLGLTINSAYDISVSKNKKHYLSPSFGIGLLEPSWDGPTSIINLGLDYRYKNYGIGCEISNFFDSPFGKDNTHYGFVDLIVYPNISYTLSTKINLYFNISAGTYFAFSDRIDRDTGLTYIEFEGDVVAGGGLTAGYKF